MLIEGYYTCQCNAVTVVTSYGEYSCKRKAIRKFFPGIDLRKEHKLAPEVFSCNHCVNHYGLDLCGCGSGMEFGKCDADLPECELPMQILNLYTRVRARNAWI